VSTTNLAAGCIACLDPLVTLTKREPDLPMGLAPSRPDLFAGRAGLHLVGLTWACESAWLMDEIAADYARAAAMLPQATIVVVANTQMESFYLSRAGIPTLLANELIFTDERLFNVLPQQPPDLATFDAIYVARLEPEKRHELAASIPSLVLTHGPPPLGGEARVRRLLPKARFANFEVVRGEYRYLTDAELVSLMNRSAVGLCLSAIEGSMRVSMEYRLAGTPVVSTRSIGGRDRYFLGPHVRVVDDDPDAVAAAVRELKAHRFSRHAVREYVGELMAFDRQNFLLNVNKLVEHHLGVRECFRTFAPFMRHPVAWRSPAQILAPLTASASAR
jgi:glycosyltransferase involved in cell wall biosynthesis